MQASGALRQYSIRSGNRREARLLIDDTPRGGFSRGERSSLLSFGKSLKLFDTTITAATRGRLVAKPHHQGGLTRTSPSPKLCLDMILRVLS